VDPPSDHGSQAAPARESQEVGRAADGAACAWAESDQYRILADSIDEGFCIVELIFDASGAAVDYRFVEVNPAFERQTGLMDATGRLMRDLAPAHESFWFETYGAVARQGRPSRFEYEAVALGRWFDVYAFRVGRPSERLVGLLFTDISERVAARLELEAAARRKDVFMTVLAHELRAPLAPMLNALTLLKLARGDAAAQARAIEILERQVGQMAALIDDLGDIGLIARGALAIERHACDFLDVVRQAVETALPAILARNHTLSTDIPDNPVPVDADASRIAQAISNLLVNAAKYTPPGGRIALGIAVQARDIWLSVSDSGVGIASDMLDKVFDMFEQVPSSRRLSQGGLGIGLALVRQIVLAHGGTVTVHSAGEGQGSEFVVRLPAAP